MNPTPYTTAKLPTFTFSDQTHPKGEVQPFSVEGCSQALREHGVVLLHNLFPPRLVETCRTAFLQRHKNELAEPETVREIQRVGDGRWMKTITVKPPFATPDLYHPPRLADLFQELLEEEYVLNNIGVVASLPGAKAQHEHRDLPALFHDAPIDSQLPCYALTVLVPLIEANHEHGTTLLRPGTHRLPLGQAEEIEGVAPVIPVGSCVIMDYRLHHGGTANRSQRIRPLLYMVYSRPWFRDYRNFRTQPPLKIARRSFRKMSDADQQLFAQAQQTWW